MKKLLLIAIVGAFIVGPANLAFSEYDGKGSMKGSKGSGHAHEAHYSDSVLQDVMEDYIIENSENGILTLTDPKTGAERNLTYDYLHSNVGTKEGMPYSCADFKDIDTGETVDVDLYMDVHGDEPAVSKAVIHKVKAKKQKGSAKGSDKGSMGGGSGY